MLLLPHHGSRGSARAAFLDAVAPRLAIASAPCRGRFGMPHPDVRARLAERAVPLAWTGRDGALLVPLRGRRGARNGRARALSVSYGRDWKLGKGPIFFAVAQQ